MFSEIAIVMLSPRSMQVGQVMQQVDARCPQALKSPAEDEVRQPDGQEKKSHAFRSCARSKKRVGNARRIQLSIASPPVAGCPVAGVARAYGVCGAHHCTPVKPALACSRWLVEHLARAQGATCIYADCRRSS